MSDSFLDRLIFNRMKRRLRRPFVRYARDISSLDKTMALFMNHPGAITSQFEQLLKDPSFKKWAHQNIVELATITLEAAFGAQETDHPVFLYWPDPYCLSCAEGSYLCEPCQDVHDYLLKEPEMLLGIFTFLGQLPTGSQYGNIILGLSDLMNQEG